LSALTLQPAGAQDGSQDPTGLEAAGPPEVYVNTELLERLAKERLSPGAPGGSTAAQPPRALLQAPPNWQLESRLYVVPLGQAADQPLPAEPAQAPPAPSLLATELQALEGRPPGATAGPGAAAPIKPRTVPQRPARIAAAPTDGEAAPGAAAAETPRPEARPEAQDVAPLQASPSGDGAEPVDPAPATPPAVAEAIAEASEAPPAPAAILDELAGAATRETPRSGRINAPPVPEPPAPLQAAAAESDRAESDGAESGGAESGGAESGGAAAAEVAPAGPPAEPASGPEARLGPAAAPAESSEPQLAARPPAKVPLQGRILFEGSSTGLSPEARAVLEGLARRLLAAESESVELRAYATGRDPRRLSLSRGLVARGYLEKLGIEAEKVFLRPLGDKAADGPSERIDYEVVTP